MKSLLNQLNSFRDEVNDHKGLYLTILGFMLFQLGADFCGT